MRVAVDYYMTLTFNPEYIGNPDLTEYADGPYAVDVPDDWTGHIVERAIEKKYGHPIESVGVSGASVHEER